ncbi:MAG: NfeD family protein [Succinivibrionaceae bacterium]|nr:NfeD family protein [Succinivibrionaceae bacterium]
MSASLLWVVATLVIIGAEMLLGSIFLLAVGAGTLMGAATAFLGGEASLQVAVAGVVAVIGVLIARRYRRAHRQDLVGSNDLDAGQSVTVTEVAADGSATVRHRGANWRATLEGGAPLTPGSYTIKETRGTMLVLAPQPNPTDKQGE